VVGVTSVLLWLLIGWGLSELWALLRRSRPWRLGMGPRRLAERLEISLNRCMSCVRYWGYGAKYNPYSLGLCGSVVRCVALW
jgi:hypothetical protein